MLWSCYLGRFSWRGLCTYLAVKSGARGIILNDAGRARDDSGISGGEYCDRLDIPFATVGSTQSCRIGNGEH